MIVMDSTSVRSKPEIGVTTNQVLSPLSDGPFKFYRSVWYILLTCLTSDKLLPIVEYRNSDIYNKGEIYKRFIYLGCHLVTNPKFWQKVTH